MTSFDSSDGNDKAVDVPLQTGKNLEHVPATTRRTAQEELVTVVHEVLAGLEATNAAKTNRSA